MNIDEMLEVLETRYDVVLLPYQKQMLLKWLNMTKEERDKDIINKVRSFYACRRPLSLRDYWPVSLYSNGYYGTTGITNSNANAEAIKINQRRHDKGLRWSVEIK